MEKILVFDNYDSFTYNLVHCIEKITGSRVDVYRNNEIALEKINDYSKIVLSPGPGLPNESGILLELIKTYAATKSIFGVCLGQQAIAEAFGGKLENLSHVFHGVATPISIIKEDYLFKDVPNDFSGGRYHSWVVSYQNFPDCLDIIAKDYENKIMAVRHKEYDLRAVQFHPESVLTPEGEKIIANWLYHK